MRFYKIFFFLIFLAFSFKANADLMYPLKEISKPECRFQNFSSLWGDCKMDLPILKTSDYTKYKDGYNTYRRIYTVLWWASYTYGWDVWNWWHSWVDIATSKWTPAYAMSDWKVVQAWFLAWRWNSVKIEHTINWRKIYSNYSHLDSVSVTAWTSISMWTKVWEIWTTWNSTWNHLHFQIDLAVSWKWPRYRSNCSEKNYDTIINTPVCFSQLNTNTIDPLLFLETNWAVVKAQTVDKPVQEVISKESILSREQIEKMEIDEFLSDYNVSISVLDFWWNIAVWKAWTVRVKVVNKRTWRAYNWNFPWDMNFKYDKNRFSLFPTWIYQIENWYRDIQVTPKIAWKMTLEIYIWKIFIKKITFWAYDSKKSLVPKTTVFWVSSKNVLSESKKWVLYFKDNYWLNLLWTQFSWKFKITSSDKTIKFCIKKVSKLSELNYIFKSDCKEEFFKNEQDFSYSNTFNWILVFDYKVTNFWASVINVTNEKWDIISSRNLSWIYPTWLSSSYAYYNDIIKISSLWLVSWINNWYFLQEKDLSRLDWVNFLRNALEYSLNKCSDVDCKNNYLQKIVELSKVQADKYSYFTRWEYTELIWEYFPLKDYDKSDFITFRDLDKTLQNYSKNILKNKTWNDYYGQTRYFQPNKNITRWEAAFLISNILNN